MSLLVERLFVAISEELQRARADARVCDWGAAVDSLAVLVEFSWRLIELVGGWEMKPHVRYQDLTREERAALDSRYCRLEGSLDELIDVRSKLSVPERVAVTKELGQLAEKRAALQQSGEAQNARSRLPQLERELELALRRAQEAERQRDEAVAALGRRS